MPDMLLIQLPVPQTAFDLQTANIPFGAACLKQAADGCLQHASNPIGIGILPESLASYLGDAALIERVCGLQRFFMEYQGHLVPRADDKITKQRAHCDRRPRGNA